MVAMMYQHLLSVTERLLQQGNLRDGTPEMHPVLHRVGVITPYRKQVRREGGRAVRLLVC